MGHLLSAGIKMQGGAPATATLTIQNSGGLASVVWFKNGVNQGSVGLAGLTTTVNSGDTFYVRATAISTGAGATIDYLLNGSYVTSYFGATIATTATFTASGGNTYLFDCYGGV